MNPPSRSPVLPAVAPRPRPRAVSRWRIALVLLAVVAAAPYLALKAAWLLGSDIGLVDDAARDSLVMDVANLATGLMEAVAVLLAVAFVHPAGRRLPAPLVQVPMFVGTGLLGGILLQIPLDVVVRVLVPRPEVAAGSASTGPLEPWVYTVVYGAFTVLGLCLLPLYVGYVRDRWARPLEWSAPLGEWPAAPSHGGVLVLGAALATAGVAAPVVLAAAGGGVGAHVLMLSGSGVLGAVGLVALAIRRPARLRGTVAVGLAWFGCAACAAWGTYTALILAVPNPLMGDAPVPAGYLATSVVLAFAGWSALPRLRGLTATGVLGR